MNEPMLAMFGLPGGAEWIIIGGIALLIFGRRLPDVARSVGKSIVEFKRGLRDVNTDIDTQARLEPPRDPSLEQKPAPPSNENAAPADSDQPSSPLPK